MVEGTASFSECTSADSLVFEWSEVTDTEVPFQSLGRTLFVPASSLQAGTELVFQLVGYPSSNPLNRGTAKVTLEVPLPDLVLSIAGGASRTVSAVSELVLDASASHDPAGVETTDDFTWEWTCAPDYDVTAVVCRDSTGAVIPLAGQPTLTFDANTLAAGAYLFRLILSSSTRRVETVQTVEIKEAAIPDVTVSPAALMVLKTGNVLPTLNPTDRVVLEAAVTSPIAGEVPTLQWSVDGQDIAQDADVDVYPLGAGAESFIIAANTLAVGQEHEVSITATGSEGTASAAFSFIVNAPPGSGTCKVSPASGYALQTKFSFACTGWVDDTQGSLRFSFGYTVGDEAPVVVQTAELTSTLESTLLPEGDVTLWARVLDVHGAMAEMTADVTVEATAVADVVSDVIEESIQKQDVAMALTVVSAGSSSLDASGRRRLAESDDAVAAELLTTLEWAMTNSLLTVNGLAPHVTALSSLSGLVSSLGTAGLARLIDVTSTLVDTHQGASMSVQRAEELVQTLGALSRPSVLSASDTPLADLVADLDSVRSGIAASVLAGQLVGEPAVLLNGEGLDLSLRKVSWATTSSAMPSPGAVSTWQLPSSLQSSLDLDGTDSLHVVSWRDAASAPAGADDFIVKSDVVGLELSTDAGVLAVSDLANPIQFTVMLHDAVSDAVSCRWWDGATETWSASGVTVAAYDQVGQSVTCETTHLSAFIVVDAAAEESSSSEQSSVGVSSSSSSSLPPPQREIRLVDDYLVDCELWADCNENGVADIDELTCTTDTNGACSLLLESVEGCPLRFLVESQPAVCRDAGSGLKPKMDLVAGGSGEVVSFLSTFRSAWVAAQLGRTEADANAWMEQAFPSLVDCNIDTCEPVAAATVSGASASDRSPLVALSQLHNTALLLTTYLEEEGSVEAGDLVVGLMADAVATRVADQGTYSLASSTDMIETVSACVQAAGSPASISVQMALANTMAELNNRASEAVLSNTGNTLRSRLAIVNYVSQELVARETEDLAEGDLSVNQFAERTNGDALDDLEVLAGQRITHTYSSSSSDSDSVADEGLGGGAIMMIIVVAVVCVGGLYYGVQRVRANASPPMHIKSHVAHDVEASEDEEDPPVLRSLAEEAGVEMVPSRKKTKKKEKKAKVKKQKYLAADEDDEEEEEDGERIIIEEVEEVEEYVEIEVETESGSDGDSTDEDEDEPSTPLVSAHLRGMGNASPQV
jgi:hypothetical protein